MWVPISQSPGKESNKSQKHLNVFGSAGPVAISTIFGRHGQCRAEDHLDFEILPSKLEFAQYHFPTIQRSNCQNPLREGNRVWVLHLLFWATTAATTTTKRSTRYPIWWKCSTQYLTDMGCLNYLNKGVSRVSMGCELMNRILITTYKKYITLHGIFAKTQPNVSCWTTGWIMTHSIRNAEQECVSRSPFNGLLANKTVIKYASRCAS